MDKQILITLLAAFSPVILNFLFKNIDNKTKNTIRKNALEEADKRIDLLNKYVAVQNNFSTPEELAQIKLHVYQELKDIKKEIEHVYINRPLTKYEQLNGFQKIFLTFKPVNIWGAIWQSGYTILAIIFVFILFGASIDKLNNISFGALRENFKTDWGVFVSIVIVQFFFRYGALKNYRTHGGSSGLKPVTVG